MIKVILMFLFYGWNLITGTDQTPDKLVEDFPCVSHIWHWDGEQWRSWDPYLDPVVATSVGIEYLHQEQAYWIECR
jgi:hypothetical protein